MQHSPALERLSCVDRTGEIAFEDPYRHLEDEAGPARAWVDDQNRRADEFFDGMEITALRADLKRHFLAAHVSAPSAGGKRWFWLRRDLDGRGDAVEISESLTGPRSTIVAAQRFAPHGNSIDWRRPSPDGRWLAVGVARSGDEQAILYLGRTDGSEGFGAKLLNTFTGNLCWLADSSGLYCMAGRRRATETPSTELWLVPVDGEPTRVELPATLRDGIAVSPQLSSDDRHLALSSPFYAPCPRAILDRRSGEWLPGLEDSFGFVFAGFIVEGQYLAVTYDLDQRGRVVKAPVGELRDRSSWQQLVGPGDRVIRGVAPCPGGFLVYELAGHRTVLRAFDLAGAPLGEVQTPPQAAMIRRHSIDLEQAAADVPVEACGEERVFSASSVTTSNALFRFRAPAGPVEQITKPEFVHDEYRARAVTVPATAEREELRVDLISACDPFEGGPRPLLLTGYGAFNFAQLPAGYLGPLAVWLEAGGVLAYAHLPGDGTQGPKQWLDATRHGRQRTFDHFTGIGEHLITEGLASARQLAISGISAGGLLVAAAITQRPELFGAAAVLMPVTDMGRKQITSFAQVTVEEYGDARLLRDAAMMRAYSPYHNVKAGTQYPPTILVCGDRDIRTPAWHARKMAAALQWACPDSSNILLRTHEDCGHQGFSAPSRMAEWIGFLMHHVGLQPGN